MLALRRHGDGYLRLPADPGRGALRVKRCDLSDGIETDPAARTVTFHLSRPDPDFLHKLHSSLVVPAGSPARLATTPPLPGTGPYMFERWDPRGDGLLVRNPHFRVWSPDRPDGFPDQIAVRLQRPQAQIAAVEHGAADIALMDHGIRGVARAQGAVRRTAAHRPRSGDLRTCSSTSTPRRSTTFASGGRSTTPSIAAGSPSSSARARHTSRPASCCRRASRDTRPRVPSPSTPTPPVPGPARTWPRRAASSPRPGRAA